MCDAKAPTTQQHLTEALLYLSPPCECSAKWAWQDLDLKACECILNASWTCWLFSTSHALGQFVNRFNKLAKRVSVGELCICALALSISTESLCV